MNTCDVLVVGGGPAGASTAFALARAGHDVALLDRAHFPRSKPCAEYLSPEASRILDNMGALEAVSQSGAAALAGVLVRAPNGREIRGRFDGAHGFRGFSDRGLSVRREILDHIVLSRTREAGVRVVEGVKATDVERDAGGTVVGARTLDGSWTARVVVGADGLRSTIARRLDLTRRSRWPRRLSLVTHFRGVSGIGELAEMHVEHDGFVGIADVGHGVTTVALVVPARRAGEIAGDKAAFLTGWIAARPHLASRFAKAARVSPVAATGPFASYAVRAWSPGAVLVGDAADFFDPFTGEGIFAALRGGEIAAEAIDAVLRGANEAKAFAAYDARRRDLFGGKWSVERVIGAVVASPPLINRAATVLSTRRDLADLLVGVTGDFIPAGEVLRWRYILSVFGLMPRFLQ